jgi:hypothetical protein
LLPSPKSGFEETFLNLTVFISLRNAAMCAAGTVDLILADGLIVGAARPGVALRDALALVNTLLVLLSCATVGMRLACSINGGGGGGGGGGGATERRANLISIRNPYAEMQDETDLLFEFPNLFF